MTQLPIEAKVGKSSGAGDITPEIECPWSAVTFPIRPPRLAKKYDIPPE
jgi:hypothetical protein